MVKWSGFGSMMWGMSGFRGVQVVETYVPPARGGERRSPWHGLTGSEALELQDAQTTPARRAMTELECARDVAAEYAERTVLALVGNDLRLALRCATIARVAITDRERQAERVTRSGDGA